jgi:hypothetical protein
MSISCAFLLAATLGFGREAPPPLVTWQDLCDRSGTWLGQTVRVQVQFSGRVETWNPYITRFGTRQFSAVQAWTDEQFPWIQAERDAPVVRVFTRRGGAGDWALESAKPGVRFEMTLIVRETFLDLPWAEVVGILPLAERISEGTAIHAGKACELMRTSAFTLAESELQQAITDDLPAAARTELERLLALCRDAIALEKRTNGTPSARR